MKKYLIIAILFCTASFVGISQTSENKEEKTVDVNSISIDESYINSLSKTELDELLEETKKR